MTFYETNASFSANTGNLFQNVSSLIGRGLRAMQYARMMQALSEMSDKNLNTIGLERSDIPRRAHLCVYGTDS